MRANSSETRTAMVKPALLVAAGWIAALWIAPAVMIDFAHRVELRQKAGRLPRAGDLAPVPRWIPVRADYRVAGWSRSAGGGSAVLETADSVDAVKEYYLREFQRSGFHVGSNLMEQNGRTSAVYLNSARGAQSALVTLRTESGGTHIDLTYSEKN